MEPVGVAVLLSVAVEGMQAGEGMQEVVEVVELDNLTLLLSWDSYPSRNKLSVDERFDP